MRKRIEAADSELNNRFILCHPEHGVYLGSCMGLGFWSKLDPAGQDCAPTFETQDLAMEYVDSWDLAGMSKEERKTFISSMTCVAVDADIDNGTWASMSACIKAGMEPWADLESMVTASMSIN
jgi:hypothetical protein